MKKRLPDHRRDNLVTTVRSKADKDRAVESFKPLPALVELLSRDAATVDQSLTIPPGHLAAFAAAGLYGAWAPKDVGGLELGFAEACDLVEQLAAACLTTTFVWLQHFRLLGSLLDPATPEHLRSMLPSVDQRRGQRRGLARRTPARSRPTHGRTN